MHALALPLSLCAAFPMNSGETDGRAEIGRTVDLRALDIATPERNDAHAVQPLVPLMQHLSRPEEVDLDSLPTRKGWSPSEAALRIFSDVHGGNVTAAEFLEPGVLYLETTPELHERFDGLHRFLERSVASAPRLMISRVAASRDQIDAALAKGDKGWVELVRDRAWSTRAVMLPLDSRMGVKELLAHTAVVGVSVEIAQGIGIGDPHVEEVATGLDLVLEGTWRGGKLRLAYMARDTDTETNNMPGIADTQLIVSTEGSGIVRQRGEGWAESFGVQGGAVAGETSMGKGDMLLLSTREDQHVAIHLLNEAPEIATYKLGGNRVAMAVAPGSFRPARIVPEGLVTEMSSSLETHSRGLFHTPSAPLTARFAPRSEYGVGLLQKRVKGIETYEVPGVTVLAFDESQTDAVRETVGFLQTDAPAVLSVRASWTAGDEAGASGAAEILDGTECGLVLGSEGFLVKDGDVEVAQNVAIREPEVRARFEGLACTIRLSTLASGELAYAITGQISSEQQRFDGAAKTAGLRGAVATRTAHTSLKERGISRSGDGSSWTIGVGDATKNGPQLVLEVTRVR